MAKEKSKGDEFSAIGRQTTARAYSAMDYYFDHLKETIASAPSGGMEFGEKVKASAEQNISATQEYVREIAGVAVTAEPKRTPKAIRQPGPRRAADHQ